ncbi:MAG: hypothetical protein JO006_10050 [Paucibacter sp.]|nr:hypothetical protein [Roseateles sp.]
MMQELRSNPRLRVGMALVLVILVSYALMLWQDRQRLAAQRYRQLAIEQLRLSQQHSLQAWPQRASDAASLMPRYEAHLWHQASFGLAQAELQDWLRQALRAVSAQGANVKIADADPAATLLGSSDSASTQEGTDEAGRTSADAHWPPTRVGAQLDYTNTDPQLTLALLAAFAAEPRTVTVDNLSIKPGRVEMRVSAWYVLGADTIAASSSASAAQTH